MQFRDARQTPCVGPTVLVDQRYQKGSSPGTKVSIFFSKVSIFDFSIFVLVESKGCKPGSTAPLLKKYAKFQPLRALCSSLARYRSPRDSVDSRFS